VVGEKKRSIQEFNVVGYVRRGISLNNAEAIKGVIFEGSCKGLNKPQMHAEEERTLKQSPKVFCPCHSRKTFRRTKKGGLNRGSREGEKSMMFGRMTPLEPERDASGL